MLFNKTTNKENKEKEKNVSQINSKIDQKQMK
jgi:hypothetical protein